MTRFLMTQFLAALVFTTRMMAQSASPVEITGEPSHHLVMTSERVRVFDVHVAPHQTTLVHAHHSDYLFVTLGDADVTSARVGDTAVRLVLRDGETRTPRVNSPIRRRTTRTASSITRRSSC
jgi:hypothetical protein